MELETTLNKMFASAKINPYDRQPKEELTKAEIDKLLSLDGVPDDDEPHGKLRYCYSMTANTVPVARLIDGVNSGNKLYPKDGYLAWHTNSDNPGVRVYFTYATKEGSFFRYLKDGQIITLEDQLGWNTRVFPIDAKEPLWHCVYASARRYSFGFNCPKVPEGFEQYLIP